MALSKKKSCELSIKEKVLVIKQKESEGKSQRELAKIFGVSKTQIQSTHIVGEQAEQAGFIQLVHQRSP